MAKKKAAKKKPAKKPSTKSNQPQRKKAPRKKASTAKKPTVKRGPSKNVLAGIRRMQTGGVDNRPLSKRAAKRNLRIGKRTGYFDSKGNRLKQSQLREHARTRNIYFREKGGKFGMIYGNGG